MSPSSASGELCGLILAGGESSRMGFDKSLVKFHNKPQREYLFEVLSEFCSQVLTSCRQSASVPAFLHPLQDAFDIAGPMNGILTAFRYDPSTAWLTAPVDMPYIDGRILSVLIRERDRSRVATCFFDSGGKTAEPLLAIWEPGAGPLLLDFFRKGKTSPKEFLATHDARMLKSPSPLVHVNINSQEDLKRFMDEKGHSW